MSVGLEKGFADSFLDFSHYLVEVDVAVVARYGVSGSLHEGADLARLHAVLLDQGLEDFVQLPPHALYPVGFENLHNRISRKKALVPQ